jgi:hypothetical protein
MIILNAGSGTTTLRVFIPSPVTMEEKKRM